MAASARPTTKCESKGCELKRPGLAPAGCVDIVDQPERRALDERRNQIRPAGPTGDTRAQMEAAFLQQDFDELLRWVREAGRAFVGREIPSRVDAAAGAEDLGLTAAVIRGLPSRRS